MGKDETPEKPPSAYMRWRVTPEERLEISSIKMQGAWARKDDVEFVDYLVQIGKNRYVKKILPVEAGDEDEKKTSNDVTETPRRAAM